MNKNTWILERLKKNQWDYNVVQHSNYYKNFKKETGSKCSYNSYKKRINEVKNSLALSGTSESDIVDSASEEDYSSYKEKELIAIIEDAVADRNSKITLTELKEIATEVKIPYNAFLQNINDLKAVIEQAYKINLLNIKEDSKISHLKNKVKVLKKEVDYYKAIESDYSAVIEAISPIVHEYERLSVPSKVNRVEGCREAVLLISDTHFDEKVDYAETDGFGEYSFSIAKDRLDHLFIRTIANMNDLNTKVLNLYFLGDIVSGIIHQELIMASELGITQTVLQLADYISQWIVKLSKDFKIKCLGIPGNHGRFFKKPHFKKKNEFSFDFFLYEFIHREVKNVIEEFIIPSAAYQITNILGYSFLNLHGDVFKGGNGLSPVSYSVNRDIAKLAGNYRRQKNLNIDYVNMGHFHTDTETKSFDGVIIILNGSMIGPNEFSLYKIKRAERPSQTFYIVEEGAGLRYKDIIYLDK